MTSVGITVLILGSPSDQQRRALEAWNPSFVSLAEDLAGDAIPDPARHAIAWLSPRALPDPRLTDEVRRFAQGSGRSVAVAEHVVESAEAWTSLGMRVVAASAGGARLSSSGPVRAPGAASVRLAGCVRIAAPARVGAHLRAINDESSAAAVVARLVGARPRWRAVALTPFVDGVRGWWRGRGNRDRAFTLAFVEGFAGAAASAKLWESLHRDPEEPQ